MPAGSTQDGVRRHNLSALLRQVHLHGPLTRAELTQRLGLNRSTIRSLVGTLESAGLLCEPLYEDRTVAGRPSLVVDVLRERAWVLAVNLGVESIVVARIGLGGHELDRRVLDLPIPTAADPAGSVARIADMAADLRRGLPTEQPMVGIGVAIAGVARREDGFIHLAPNLGWHEVPLGTMLADRLGTDVPLVVANDADLGALAEHTRGAARGTSHMIYLSVDVGVGAGIISANRPLTGVAGYAGEVGHMKVSRHGLPCRCGSSGCWETEVGEAAVLRRAGRPPEEGVAGLRAVLDDADRGARTARAALAETGRWLGLGLATLVNLLNPRDVVLGGLLPQMFVHMEHAVRAELHRACLCPAGHMVRLVLPAAGEDPVLVGAAESAFIPFLADPLGMRTR